MFNVPYHSCGAQTKLLDSMAATKLQRNTEYLMKLSEDNLLVPFRFEAGIYSVTAKKTDFHWGWDSPLSYLRGTFTGHWLSAAAQIAAQTENHRLRAKADYIVSEIAVCQNENGGRWAFGIPEKYLLRLKDKKKIWAPLYVCHKVMAGLFDMYHYLNNKQAFEVLLGCADWFYDFTGNISREEMDDMMDFEETGGILELWANLYSVTGDPKHLDLIRRFERPRLYDLLLAGVDALTNKHANTTIPEICGAAAAYEATGEERYRNIVESYWKQAVDERGCYVTGGQTSGEIWTPPFEQAARLGAKNQEHCVVYNMMRLSWYLYRWTGESKYADYWEKNLYNGIFAQCYYEDSSDQLADEDNPVQKGHVAYYLPLAAGSKIIWGNETDHFWCCHCTMVQSNANFCESVFFTKNDVIDVAQFIPAELDAEINGAPVKIIQKVDNQSGDKLGDSPVDREIKHRPDTMCMNYQINGSRQTFTVRFRKPEWLTGDVSLFLNGEEISSKAKKEKGHLSVTRKWFDDTVSLVLPMGLSAYPLPDRKGTVAFRYGPIALAGLCGEERTLYGDIDDLKSFMAADDERRWNRWGQGWRTVGQPVNFSFIPMYDIGYKTYTVYFPVEKRQ